MSYAEVGRRRTIIQEERLARIGDMAGLQRDRERESERERDRERKRAHASREKRESHFINNGTAPPGFPRFHPIFPEKFYFYFILF